MTEDTRAMTLRVPEPLHQWLRRAAFEQGVSMNQLVIAAIEKEKENAACIPGR